MLFHGLFLLRWRRWLHLTHESVLQKCIFFIFKAIICKLPIYLGEMLPPVYNSYQIRSSRWIIFSVRTVCSELADFSCSLFDNVTRILCSHFDHVSQDTSWLKKILKNYFNVIPSYNLIHSVCWMWACIHLEQYFNLNLLDFLAIWRQWKQAVQATHKHSFGVTFLITWWR